MKKITCMMLCMVLLCLTLVGCNQQPSKDQLKYTIPYNASIQLDEKMDKIIEAEKLVKSQSDESTDYESYDKKEPATINGMKFNSIFYTFRDDQLAMLNLYSEASSDLNGDYDKMEAYLDEIYGTGTSGTDGKWKKWHVVLASGSKFKVTLTVFNKTNSIVLRIANEEYYGS